MRHLASELSKIIDENLPRLQATAETTMSHKPSQEKWSKKEVMGHLIDSAQNNLRRFIVCRYEDSPVIVYKQDIWVKASGYQQMNTADILQLWGLLNKQLCRILENTDESMAKRLCKTEELHSLEWLAEDYIKHLQHHLNQVFERQPVAQP